MVDFMVISAWQRGKDGMKCIWRAGEGLLDCVKVENNFFEDVIVAAWEGWGEREKGRERQRD